MRKFSIIRCSSQISQSLVACQCILDDNQFRFEEIVDVKGASTLSKGKINPASGFVIVTPDEEILLDYYDLVEWLNKKGLRKI